MSEYVNGEELRKAVSQIRILFSEVALLLRTADEQMGRRGWEPAYTNYCLTGMSQSIAYPAQWLPYFAYRLYKTKNIETKLVFLSAILDIESYDRDLLPEPLVSVVVAEYPEKIEHGKLTGEELDMARWHVYMPGYMPLRRNDGATLTCDDPKAQWPQDKCKATKLQTFGVPLARVSDSQQLERQLVEPMDRLGRGT